MMSTPGTWHLGNIQRPTDRTRACLELTGRAPLSDELSGRDSRLHGVLMSHRILIMVGRQGPQHGSQRPQICRRSVAAHMDQCADLPETRCMPDLWMHLSPGPVRMLFLVPYLDQLANKDHRVDFLAGQFFDIRLEVHAPVNGSEANGGIPDPNFAFSITRDGKTQPATEYFGLSEPALERWNFTWYEGMYPKRPHCIPDFSLGINRPFRSRCQNTVPRSSNV